jgi:TolA-binding protein
MLDTIQVFEPSTEEDDEIAQLKAIVGASFAERTSRRRRLVFALAASFIAVLGVLFYMVYGGIVGGAHFDLAQGSISLNGKTITQGDRFRLGTEVASPTTQDALIEIPGALFIAVEKSAEIRLIDSSPRRMRIAVDKGRAAINLVPNGSVNLTVVLPNGEVDVIGTVFVVDADTTQNQVEVIKGTVSVKYKKAGARHRRVSAGWALSFNDEAQPRERKAVDSDPLLQLLGIEDRTDAVVAKENQDEDETDSVSSSTRRKSAGAGGTKPPLEDLFASARECRLAEDWSCAVNRYKKVIALYPSRSEATNAMVSAGQILLEKMASPADALTYFRRYQRRRPSGGLGREALFGECTALKALHKTGEERECLRKYLEKYPGTLYSKMANSRLDSIVEN